MEKYIHNYTRYTDDIAQKYSYLFERFNDCNVVLKGNSRIILYAGFIKFASVLPTMIEEILNITNCETYIVTDRDFDIICLRPSFHISIFSILVYDINRFDVMYSGATIMLFERDETGIYHCDPIISRKICSSYVYALCEQFILISKSNITLGIKYEYNGKLYDL